MEARAPKGTKDLLPASARLWEQFARTATEVFSLYGYEPIYTPLFEHTSLFTRGIGEATDIVTKEMYSVMGSAALDKISKATLALFEDDSSVRELANPLLGEAAKNKALKESEQFALRPEGTASVVRAVIEHNLIPPNSPALKLCYTGPMFRYERPQKGRQRQFWQIGAEAFGATEPSIDAELIIMMMRYFASLGICGPHVHLLINSMGDDACRPAYRDKIKAFVNKHNEEFCEDCNRRAETDVWTKSHSQAEIRANKPNPLRVFDCKNEGCQKALQDAPKLVEELCEDCRDHYAAVRNYLDEAGISYTEDHRLVRGLDYYTRTVFEVQVDAGLGAQNAIGGGGRYDKLVELLGGKPTPGIGFALGFERMALAYEYIQQQESEKNDRKEAEGPQTTVFVSAVEEKMRPLAFAIASALRDRGIATEVDHQNRSLKSQFKHADKLDALYMVIVGPDEAKRDTVTLRDMLSKEEIIVGIDEVAQKIEAMIDAWEIEQLSDTY